MVKATWNGVVIAEAKDDEVVLLEGNTYFPPGNVKAELVKEIDKTSTCGWKGLANYYDVVAEGKTNPGAAWVYKDPKDAAKNIKGFIAFWKGVQVG